MVNFLKETISVMGKYTLDPKEIIYIGDRKSSCSWEDFQKIANIEYDNGYGGVAIIKGLIIVFKNGVEMYRGGYDGREGWEVHIPFNINALKEQGKLSEVKDFW